MLYIRILLTIKFKTKDNIVIMLAAIGIYILKS